MDYLQDIRFYWHRWRKVNIFRVSHVIQQNTLANRDYDGAKKTSSKFLLTSPILFLRSMRFMSKRFVFFLSEKIVHYLRCNERASFRAQRKKQANKLNEANNRMRLQCI